MTVDLHDLQLDHVMIGVAILVDVVGQCQRIRRHVRGIHERFHGYIVRALDEGRDVVGVVGITGAGLLDRHPFDGLRLAPFGRGAAIAERFGLPGFHLGCRRRLENRARRNGEGDE